MKRSRLNKQKWYHRNESIKLNTLKKGTWLSILATIGLTAILIIPFILSREYEEVIESAHADYTAVKSINVSPTPVPMADQKTQDEMIAVIKKVWRKDWAVGVAIASCESGLRPFAYNGANTNGSNDTGLFQVNSIHGIDRETLENPIANAGYAYALYVEQGLNPWSASKHCWEGRL